MDGVQTAYTYDANDRLQQSGGTLYSYDNNGSTLTETLDGVVTAYTYNPNGIRSSKTEAGTTTRYIIDENATTPKYWKKWLETLHRLAIVMAMT